MLQCLAQGFITDHLKHHPQILLHAIGHHMRQKMHGIGKRLIGVLEPDNPFGHAKHLRSTWQWFHIDVSTIIHGQMA